MPLETRHNDVKLITTVEFVEALSALLDLGTQQAEKLTLAKSFSTKQDRYALLDNEEGGTLIDALVGTSVLPNITQSDDARKVVHEFLAFAQQLVSWIQASLVHDAIDQDDLNIAVSQLFGTPQLMSLVLALLESDLLQDCSPLKQLPVCVDELIRHDFDPVKTCKEVLRTRIQDRLDGRPLVGLGFLKHINSLDSRSSTRPSTQRREIMELNKELASVLKNGERQVLIDELTGIYTAMMALNQLHRRTYERQPQYFPSVVRQLQKDFHAAVAPTAPQRRLVANHNLFLLMLNAKNPERLTATISNTPSFKTLLENHASFSSKGLPNLLRDFLRDGMTRSWNKTRLLKVKGQLDRFYSKPYYNGVTLFIFGLLAVSEQDLGAQRHFEHCLDAAGSWPLGPFRSQAALFSLGLKLAQEPSQSPNAWNPLLSEYLNGLPQYFRIQLVEDEQESVEMYNLRELIGQYNSLCWTLIGHANAMMVNPFRKIDAYLQRIFDGLHQCSLAPTAENLAAISKKLTTKRDVERVNSDFYGTPLYQWLTERNFKEILRTFPHPDMWELVPAISRYLDLPEPMREAIARSSAPSMAGEAS